MSQKKILTHEEIDQQMQSMANAIQTQIDRRGYGLKIFGIPRGGVPVAYLLLNYLGGGEITSLPTEADIIVDDILDSGATATKYIQKYNKPFFSLYSKQNNPDLPWLVFPWEQSEEKSIEDACLRLLQFVGEDPNREGLKETPARMAKAWQFWTSGYDMDPKAVFKEFKDGGEKYDEMIVLDPIPFYSHCVVGSTFIDTPKGRIPIKHLKHGDWIYTVDPKTKELDVVQCQNPRKTQCNANLVRVYSDNDTVLCTPDHKFLTHNRGWVEAQYLIPGDSVVSLYRSLEGKYTQLIASRSTRWSEKNGAIKIAGKGEAVPEHRFVYGITSGTPIRGKKGRPPIVHHEDEIRWNNLPENLTPHTINSHNKVHGRFNGETNKPSSPHYEKRKDAVAKSSATKETRKKRSDSVKAYWAKVKANPKKYKKRCNQTSEGIQVSDRNHKIIGVESVPWKEDVYCMNVPKTKTFFANGMAVHNCEHHMAAIFGDAYIAYIPSGKIAGLSKFPRLVDIFARRLQVQERLTTQIADTIESELKPKGVAVLIKARHFCMESRGVQKAGVSTKTSAMRGDFLNDPATRNEFFSLIKI